MTRAVNAFVVVVVLGTALGVRAVHESQVDERRRLREGVARGHFDYQDDLEEMASAIMALVEAIILPLRHQEHSEVNTMLSVLARTLFRAYAKSSDLVERARAI